MTQGHRYRLLIYFAALVLCLSVCFAYAEAPASIPTSSAATSACTPAAFTEAGPAHLLFYTTPGRASFMPTLSEHLVAEAIATEKPVYADAALNNLMVRETRSHGLIHGIFSSHHKLKLVTSHAPEHLAAASSDSAQMIVAGEEPASQQ